MLKEGRGGERNLPYPRSFSRLTVVELLGGCILYLMKHKRKKHQKTAWGRIFLFVSVRQSPCQKKKRKTKRSRQFWSHALRYASLITCLPNSFRSGPSLVTSELDIVTVGKLNFPYLHSQY